MMKAGYVAVPATGKEAANKFGCGIFWEVLRNEAGK